MILWTLQNINSRRRTAFQRLRVKEQRSKDNHVTTTRAERISAAPSISYRKEHSGGHGTDIQDLKTSFNILNMQYWLVTVMVGRADAGSLHIGSFTAGFNL